ncbi:MAG: hypothetical protein DMG98_03210 [Acidobacteria bacterium]|nr:MAG: hypothetical protein DMG98_03210 [Acidobacteriota bacterium]
MELRRSVAYIAVNGSGLVSGNAVGSANISATSGSVTGSTSITVIPAVISSIAGTPGSATIPAGATQQFTATATFTDSSTQDVSTLAIWTSSSGSIANISSSGLADSGEFDNDRECWRGVGLRNLECRPGGFAVHHHQSSERDHGEGNITAV